MTELHEQVERLSQKIDGLLGLLEESQAATREALDLANSATERIARIRAAARAIETKVQKMGTMPANWIEGELAELLKL